MKGTLSLKPRKSDQDDEQLDDDSGMIVDQLDLRLPCRVFEIEYQVADIGKFSLTTEFLLRILKATGRLTESDIGKFFSFSPLETAYVINAAERKEYVSRAGEWVTLTEAGDDLFETGSDEPSLYEVQKKTGWFLFDLVSFCPSTNEELSRFDLSLPELPILDPNKVANASREVRESFRKNFYEIQLQHGGHVGEKSSLYSLSETIVAQGRKYVVVPVQVRSRVGAAESVEPDLLEWKSGVDLENRIDVLNSAAQFLREQHIQSLTGNASGADVISDLYQGTMARYMKGGVFNKQTYFKAAAALKGELRRDRRTTRTFGSLWLQRNAKIITSAMKYSLEPEDGVSSPVIWMRPDIPLWGCSRDFEKFVGYLAGGVDGEKQTAPAGTLLLSHDDKDAKWRFEEVFDRIEFFVGAPPHRDLEILLIPGRVCAAMVHGPLGISAGYPIALGFVSFDPNILWEVQAYLSGLIEGNFDIKDQGDLRLLDSLKFRLREKESMP